MNNVQTFSQDSDQYARYRPSYPEDLFSFLSGISAGHDRVWDCATGSGQAAVPCTEYFAHVDATDISAEQIRHGITHPRVTYRVCSAESTSFTDRSFDLILVAQALHWFDLDKFYREAGRVLKPGGILAAFGYAFFEIEPEIDTILRENLLEPIDRFWSEGNRLLMSGYREISLPFEAVAIPRDFTMRVAWTMPQLSAYLRTWSAVKRFLAETGDDPVTRLEERLLPFWTEPEKSKPVRMPLYLKVSRKPFSPG